MTIALAASLAANKNFNPANMQQRKQTAIVMNSDPQVLKGLVLMLSDMRFEVIAVSHIDDLESITPANSNSPDLLICADHFESNTSIFYLVKKLRNSFADSIPAILITSDSSTVNAGLPENTLMLSDQIRPAALRQKINELAANAGQSCRHFKRGNTP